MSSPTHIKSSVAEGGNPLKFDAELRGLLGDLEHIKSYKKFKKWKSSFLTGFASFLATEGIGEAEGTYDGFKKGMDKMMKAVDKVDDMMQSGALTNERATVKGRGSLNELCKNLTICCEDTEQLIPSTGVDEQKKGFNKFQLGAVLVQDGFSEYDRMKRLNDLLIDMQLKVSDIADRQQLDLFQWYGKKFKNFCDVMADLGLYEVMMACRRFAEEPEEESESESEPEPEPEPDPEYVIFIDGKTANVFQIDLEEAFEKGYITPGDSPKSIKEACKSPEEREEIRKNIKGHATLGVATQIVVGKMVNVDDEHTALEDIEKVTSMWGVSLKSRAKRKKGEDFFFLDPIMDSVGTLDRETMLKKGAITEYTNAHDKLDIKEAVHGHLEHEAIVEKIRQSMGIRLDM